jgi:hypothetical protein
MNDLATAFEPTRLLTATGLEPDPWQRELLMKPWNRALLNVTRQGGKSTAVAALTLHTALYRSKALVIVLAPARRQSKEVLLKAWSLYRDAGRPVSVDNRSELRIRFDNGSRIIALPGSEKTVRGYSDVDLIVADEAARVPGELYRTVRPMLAVSGGRLIGMSTPWGRRGWFFEAWTDPDQEWKRVKVTGPQCSRLSDEFLQQERREMPDSWFRSEYLCEFTDTVDTVFSMTDVDAMESGVPALFGADAPDATSEEIPTIA